MSLFGPPNVENLKVKKNVGGLIKALNYKKDKKVRRAAAVALGEIQDIRAIDPLIVMLRCEELDLCDTAAGALRRIIVAINDKDGKVRKATVDALAEIGAPAVEPLIAALDYHNEHVVQEAAANALGKIRDPRAVEPLITDLKQTLFDTYRKTIVDALVEIGTPAIGSLVEALTVRSVKTQAYVTEALERLEWQPDNGEAGANYWIAKRQWDKCIDIGAPAVEPLIAALKKAPFDLNQTAKNLYVSGAAKALGQIGDMRALDPLIDQAIREASAAHGKPGRDGAEWALARFGPEVINTLFKYVHKDIRIPKILSHIGSAAVEPLIALLQNGDNYHRRTAIWGLGEIGGERAVEALAAVIRSDDSERLVAIRALTGIKSPQAIDALCELSNIKNVKYRVEIVKELGNISDIHAVESLIEVLKDTEVRNSAAIALGEIGDPRAINPLIAALDTTDSEFIKSIAKGLAKIYNSGQFSAEQKRLILAKKEILEQLAHSDEGVDCHHQDHTYYQTDFLL